MSERIIMAAVIFGVAVVGALIWMTMQFPAIPEQRCKRHEQRTYMVGFNIGGVVVINPVNSTVCVEWEVRS